MTDNEIIKALKCCIKRSCDKCERLKKDIPNEHDCRLDLMRISLGLIARQQAEIEILKNENMAKEAEYNDMLAQRNSVERHLEIAKSEAVKEFVERLKKHSRKMQSSDFSGDFWDAAVLVEDIDKLVKEMEGTKNEN